MGFHLGELVDCRQVAHATLAVQVKRPAGFDFRPGQYVDVTIPEPRYSDGLGPIRSFSIASAPDAERLEFVMRMRPSAFKRSLVELVPGTPLILEGPFPDLELEAEPERERVLLAGGVGVAPFLSLLRDRATTGAPLNAVLFYSNRRPEDAAFLDELVALARAIDGFRFVPTMTAMASSSTPWDGETRRIGLPLLQRELPSLAGPSWFIVGSPEFVSGTRSTLWAASVPPRDIALELYTGY